MHSKDNLIFNIIQLIEFSNIVYTKKITLGDNHTIPNLDKIYASHYELGVANHLDKLKNINSLKYQKTFNDCKDKNRLSFDVYF